jgi:hypothetical protein
MVSKMILIMILKMILKMISILIIDLKKAEFLKKCLFLK